MGTAEDVNKVKKNILSAYEKRHIGIVALSLDYAGRAINIFRANQTGEQYWNNQTRQAMDTMFSGTFDYTARSQVGNQVIGWFLSHFERYGIYLELANDRQNEAIRPIIKQLARQFYKDAREIV